MALAAAWFETDEDNNEGAALRWLEKLRDPELMLPPSADVFPRKVVDVYVPVNDQADPFDWPDKTKKPTIHPTLGSVSVGRSRQARTFPSIWVGESPCFLHWPNADAAEVDTHRPALDRLTAKVTRIGHSSSLVRMWVAEVAHAYQASETWVPDEGVAHFQARSVSEGTLNLLDLQFNRRNREQHERLSAEIAKLEAAKKALKGKDAKQGKAEIDIEIGKVKDRLKLVDNRDPIRPKLGLWSGYRRRDSESPTTAQAGDFDTDVLVLTQIGGPRLPSVSTLAVTQALRGAVMKHSGLQPPPPWVSGHLETGEPVRDGKQHLAVLPLPFVSSDYADGHLLGAALAFPRWVSRKERGRVLGPILLESSGEPKSVALKLGALGVWTIIKRDWSEPHMALKAETWSAHAGGSLTWASVTPVVLDGFPKEDRLRDRLAWNSEVFAMLFSACQRIGLPKPASIDFDNTSWHQGSPRASMKRRPLRGHPEVAHALAGLGDGFPPYPAKATTGIRPQFHVWLRFAEPVVGPVVLGAGRFLGYGLCKPLWGGAER
jgi:CRISPR-associated protein Csb2